MRPVVQRWWRGLRDVFFPPMCVHCRGLVENEHADAAAGGFRHLCRTCAAQVALVAPPHCSACGHPFFGALEGERQCVKCDGLAPVFNRGRTASLFKGPVRSLVIELKYHRGLHVLEDVAEILRRSPHVLEAVRGARLVPVPLHARKERERGYNQARLIADQLARVAGEGTVVAPVLRRVVDTETQTAFDREERRRNLKNAFALVRGASLTPGQHHVLVDDVFTTGSTLNSCAGVLRDAGVVNLDVVTLAHG